MEYHLIIHSTKSGELHYNLRELLVRTEDPVLFVEGEKTAEAAKKLFGEYVVVTTAGGAGCPKSTDFDPLRGRTVWIWRDNDGTGLKYQELVTSLLSSAGASKIHQVEIPDTFPPKWDLADPLPESCSKENVTNLLVKASEVKNEPSSTSICMSDVTTEAIDFLWYPYIPKGRVTIIDGDPGVGKSHVTLAIASALSKAQKLPGQREASHGRTLLFSCEDDISSIMRPRLERMGANCDLIFADDGVFSLDESGISRILSEIVKRKPDLVVLDPIVSYLGGRLDINKANKVRAALQPLMTIAAEQKCAMVIVRHLNKNAGTQSLMYRGNGSIDFMAAVRSGLTVLTDPSNEETRVILHTKHNYSEQGSAVQFTFIDETFEWIGLSEVREQNFLVPQSIMPRQTAPCRSEAEIFLKQTLATRNLPSTEVFELAEIAGITKSSLKRAKSALNVRSIKTRGNNAHYIWSLSKVDSSVPKQENDDPLEQHGLLESHESLRELNQLQPERISIQDLEHGDQGDQVDHGDQLSVAMTKSILNGPSPVPLDRKEGKLI